VGLVRANHKLQVVDLGEVTEEEERSYQALLEVRKLHRRPELRWRRGHSRELLEPPKPQES